MNPEEKKILVAGDAAVDWFLHPVEPQDSGDNWQLHGGFHTCALPGGALLLSDFVKASLEASEIAAEVRGPVVPGPLRNVPCDEVIHASALLDAFPPKGKAKVLRIRQSLGFMGPNAGRPTGGRTDASDFSPDILVLDDVGNGFRYDETAWSSVLGGAGFRGDAGPVVVHKMSLPIATGPLWRAVQARDCEEHVVVVHAADLRHTPGVDISASLSWERTARSCVFQLQRSEELQDLSQAGDLVVLFGTDGALIYSGRERRPALLVFDPEQPEGGFAAGIEGAMHGLTTVVTATLVSEIAQRGLAGLESGVRRGLARARLFLQLGFERTPEGIAYPLSKIFSRTVDGGRYASCTVPAPRDFKEPDRRFWRILEQKTRKTRHIVAEQTVLAGRAKGLKGVPVGKFGILETIDRAEIESYGAIRELILEFLANPKPARPLCFAVFGPPGSGKSFGVKQVAKSLHIPDEAMVTFNISQFRGYADLVAAFHKVRDLGLEGHVPFVFFDEFDSANEDGPLGWLKYYLAPMQDAQFKEEGEVHPIGKAIFVFAGGTRSSLEKFVRNEPDEDHEAAARPGGSRTPESVFREAKGPDFVSRLRGFINVMGPNRQHESDDAFIIRRAKVLRVLLQFNPKTAGLFDTTGMLRIDDGVLRALLSVTKYRHGTRSMEALLDMSRLAGKRRFDLSVLPPKDQLDLHVDADEFLFIAERERFQSLALGAPSTTQGADASYRQREAAIVDAAARLIHEDYVRERTTAGQSGTVQPFEELPPEKKASNVDAAEDIPRKLRLIGYGLRPLAADRDPSTPDISDDDVDRLAVMEHDRWCRDQKFQGWVYGPTRDLVRRTSPYLVPFDRLSDDVRQYDVQAVLAIPRIVKGLGYEIYRMEEVDELDDAELIDGLARAIHEAYRAERKKEGDTEAGNPSIVAFDALPADLRVANVDNALTIPRKLQAIGCGIRRARAGQPPVKIELTRDDIETMAILEHARWNWQKLLQGWIFAPGKKDGVKKTTPHLVPWRRLSTDIQDYDRQTVALIPALLAEVGYEAYRERG